MRELGRGGMGVVYLAKQTSLGRTVAVKVLRQGASRDDAALNRLRKEGRMMKDLSHPNVVRLLDFDVQSPTPFLVFEYVAEGPTLETLLEGGGRPVAQTLPILAGMAGALAYLHSKGIMHRDLKPGNVLLGAGGEPRVIDFGLSRSVSADETRQTQDGHVVGTLSYMAPEQMRGLDATPASDVYAWGLIAYELLSRQFVFTSRAMSQQISPTFRYVKPVASLRERAPGVPAALAGLVMACLEQDPARRPSASYITSHLDAGTWTENCEPGTKTHQGRLQGADATIPTGIALPFAAAVPPLSPSSVPFKGGLGLITCATLAVAVAVIGRVQCPGGGTTGDTMPHKARNFETGSEPASVPRAADLQEDLATIAQRTRQIDRAWLKRNVANVRHTVSSSAAPSSQHSGLTSAALDAVGITQALQRVLEVRRSGAHVPMAETERSAWADCAGLELLEHDLVALGEARPFDPSVIALAQQAWPATDALSPVDDSWTSYVRNGVGREERGEDDVRFQRGPFTYDLLLPSGEPLAVRLWFATTSPEPAYVIDTELNSHRLVLRPGHPDGSAKAFALRARREATEVQGWARWAADREILLAAPESEGARCYVGREIPPSWIHPGRNCLVVNEYDLPGAGVNRLDPPCVWTKVLSVRWARALERVPGIPR